MATKPNLILQRYTNIICKDVKKRVKRTWTLGYERIKLHDYKGSLVQLQPKVNFDWFQHLLSPGPCHHRLPSVTTLQRSRSVTLSFVRFILGAHSLKVLRGCVKTNLTASDVKNHASIHFIGGPTAAIDEVTTTRLTPAWTLQRFCRQSGTHLVCAYITHFNIFIVIYFLWTDNSIILYPLPWLPLSSLPARKLGQMRISLESLWNQTVGISDIPTKKNNK